MDPFDREELRITLLQVLVARMPGGTPAETLRTNRAIRTLDFEIPPSEMEAALAYLLDLKLVESRTEELGSTVYWRATATGVQLVERKPGAPRRD